MSAVKRLPSGHANIGLSAWGLGRDMLCDKSSLLAKKEHFITVSCALESVSQIQNPNTASFDLNFDGANNHEHDSFQAAFLTVDCALLAGAPLPWCHSQMACDPLETWAECT